MFGGSSSVKVSKELMDKLKAAAEMMGCASVNELVETMLADGVEKIMSQGASKAASAKEVDDITKKLQGLGYLE